MSAPLVWGIVLIGAVLLLGELSARVWRRTRPTGDRFTRFRQWRIFSSAWMLVAAGVVALLVATRVIAPPR